VKRKVVPSTPKHRGRGYYPLKYGGIIMAMIRLMRHRAQGAIEIRGLEGVIHKINSEPVEVCVRTASLYLGDENMIVDFTSSDKKEISELPENRLKLIRKHFNVEEGGDVLNVLYPKKKSVSKKKVAEIVETVVETITPIKTEVKATPTKKTTKKTNTKKDVN